MVQRLRGCSCEISVEAVKTAIQQGLILAENPTNAKENRKIIELRANPEDVQRTALTFYDL